MAYQTLYRRYRSQTFGDLRGQDHVVRALRSAVRDDRVGHAYLFSGPRGTGKTSTARILAKALNCDDLRDGDPCGVCESCRAIESGSSFDLHELDAASNNGVEAIRDLISRTGIGSPGRTKVYILDEVHMLSAGASNALLKTLEDPPPHVVFVLATTDPHKVLPTIRSRTQHLEFGLIGAEVLEQHVRWVIADAGLDVAEEGIAYALRQGGGSARDTLSALEQVVAAGGVPDAEGGSDDILEALCERDAGAAMSAVASAIAVGREPRPLAESLLGALRDVFLASVGGPLGHLTEAARQAAEDRARRMGRAAITRALDLLGEAIAEMRHVGDTRIPLEVALVRLTAPEIDTSVDALVERVNRLERLVESPPPAPVEPATDPTPPAPPFPPPSRGRAPQEPATGSDSAPAGRAVPPRPAPAPEPERQPGPDDADRQGPALPSLDEVASAWQRSVLPSLPNRARARFGACRIVAVDSHAVMALPNPIHRDRCDEIRPEVEAALAAHFGRPVPVRLIVDGEAGTHPPRAPADDAPTRSPSSPADRPDASDQREVPAPDALDELDDIGDVSELDDADVPSTSSIDRITEMFPGAQVVEE